MMHRRLLLIVAVGVLCLHVAVVQSLPDNGKEITADDDGSFLEVNPGYQSRPKDRGEDDDRDSDDSDDDSDDEFHDTLSDSQLKDRRAVKGALNSALAKSKKQSKKTMVYIKKNRGKITLALTVFAFRREIRQALLYFIRTQKVTPTSSLKIALFVYIMWTTLNKQNNKGIMDGMTALGEADPLIKRILGMLMAGMIRNPAFLPPLHQHYTFERINERYLKDGLALQKAVHAKSEAFTWPKSEPAVDIGNVPALKDIQLHNHSKSLIDDTVIVLDWTKLDSSLTNMELLRDQVSFLLSEYRAAGMQMKRPTNKGQSSIIDSNNATSFEVIVVLESPGGSATNYGLAAQQLLRLRNEEGILLTVCVDKVGASGGYMIACVSSPGRLFAAPFSLVGSIGVVGQIVNVHQLLDGWGISPLVFRGGKDKAPLGLFGEVTDDGKENVQRMIDATHRAFKEHVATNRPVLADTIDEVGNGDVWLGTDAIKIGLVDRLITSDEYIAERMKEGARAVKLVRLIQIRSIFGVTGVGYPNSELKYGMTRITNFLQQGISKIAHSLSGYSIGGTLPTAATTTSASIC